MTVTLDYFKTHPLRVAKDQSDLTIGEVIKACDETVIEPPLNPIQGAFIHYGGVELADMLTLTQPSVEQHALDQMAEAWYASCGIVAKQLLFYLWWISSKELGHGTTAMSGKAFANYDYDPDAVAIVNAVCNGNYKDAVKAGSAVKVGPYISAVEQHFRNGGWVGAFGGKKWADIALVFKRYIYGEVSAMIAADRAWTLVHNTGPIFNKGFYFKNANPIEVLNAQAKHSVFDLGIDTILDKHDHPVNEPFKKFCKLAVAAIKTVKPDYEAGAEGSGGFKDGSAFEADNHKPGGKKVHKFGTYATHSGERAEQ